MVRKYGRRPNRAINYVKSAEKTARQGDFPGTSCHDHS